MYHLPTWIRRYRKRIPVEMIPVATDPGGNIITLGITSNLRGKVYLWDHEEEVDEGEVPDYRNIYFVADSFQEFLNSLD